jgi:hypothetical protein
MQEQQASVVRRYHSGERETVWAEFEAGVDRFGEPIPSADAQAVVSETMGRVKQNLDRLTESLTELGYDFTKQLDGSPKPWEAGPRIYPNEDTSDLIGGIEMITGRLPLSLVAFWEVVGGVDLTGHFAERPWPSWCAPLHVYSADEFLREVKSLKQDFAALTSGQQEHAVWSIDSLGDSLTIALPTNNQIDFLVEELPTPTRFVSYLRLAFHWGGFPGFANYPNYPTPPEILALSHELLPL